MGANSCSASYKDYPGVHLPIFVSLLSIAAILIGSIAASFVAAARGDEGSRNRERR